MYVKRYASVIIVDTGMHQLLKVTKYTSILQNSCMCTYFTNPSKLWTFSYALRFHQLIKFIHVWYHVMSEVWYKGCNHAFSSIFIITGVQMLGIRNCISHGLNVFKNLINICRYRIRRNFWMAKFSKIW